MASPLDIEQQRLLEAASTAAKSKSASEKKVDAAIDAISVVLINVRAVFRKKDNPVIDVPKTSILFPILFN